LIEIDSDDVSLDQADHLPDTSENRFTTLMFSLRGITMQAAKTFYPFVVKSRTTLLILALSLLALILLPGNAVFSAEKSRDPNIVFIIADDKY